MNYEERVRRIISRERDNKESEAARFLEKIQEKPKLCLWGLGSHGHNWHSYLKSLGIHADCVYDASPETLAAWHGKEERLAPPPPGRARTEYLADMTVLVTMRNARPLMDALRADGFYDVYAPTVNFFSFDASLRYAGNPAKLQEMEREVCNLLRLCGDDASREIVCQTVEKYFDEAHVQIDCIPNQYFVQPLVPLTDEECFVDVGAFDGDTIDAFLRAVDGKYRHIHAFEMSKRNYMRLARKIQGDMSYDAARISLYPYGASDKDGTAHYHENNTSSVFSDDGTETAEFRRLDDVLRDQLITFIKMDIEGAEPQALAGAEEIIRTQKPKLAICTYHRAEHLWEIPTMVRQMNPAYQIYFRHHDMDEMETVCYAIP